MAAGRPSILVINPNSNQAVTDGMAKALQPLLLSSGPEIICRTLEEGPFGIESQCDIESVTLPLRDLVRDDNLTAAFVIACYSDPGLQVCREVTDKPVFGIQECGVLTALTRGDRVGVIAIKDASIRRHMRALRQMGVIDRLAGERAVNLTVAESAQGEGTFARLCAVGRDLKDLDGADVIVLGCAGMAAHRIALERALGIPVIDPVQAAVTMAIGAVLVG